MRARDAKSLEEVCSLEEDNTMFDLNSIITDGSVVTLSNRTGQSLDISRTAFNVLVDWYCQDQKSKPA